MFAARKIQQVDNGWLLDAYLCECVQQADDFLVLPPGDHHLGDPVGNTSPNQVCIAELAPDNPTPLGSKRLTLFLSPQTVDQREHAACVGEACLRQGDAVEDQPDAVVQAKDRVRFSSLSRNPGRNVGGIEHTICSRGEAHREPRLDSAGLTDAGRASIQFVRFGCVERDGFFSSVQDERVVNQGVSFLSDREKGERDRPILS